MAVFKCKMCGGALEINGEGDVAVCEYCGSVQTLPKRNDEVVANLFNRANNLRIKCEFDKAAQVYEKILNEDNSDSEAHWGLVLCKYGIEYVEDPKTYKRIPTCHRTQYESVLSDVDYLSALSNSDAQAKDVYKAQAEEISELQKNILAIVKNEKPFDVFICYKETDENGKRSVDSTIANDIYYQLTQEGLKVFYAAITLEDKLGQEYEPYIFAALNSAKVMLVVGTKPEYFDSIWVRNEWSRYLKLMKNDRSRLLIPCYRDMDAYDLPEEFAHLQAQDMGKIGFVNDIVRGIKKVVEQPKSTEAEKETTVPSNGSSTASLLERAFMFLEDGDWQNADEYCEKVLDIEPKNASAYLGKLMAELKINKREDMRKVAEPFDERNNCQKAGRFDAQIAKELADANAYIRERNENARKEAIYRKAVTVLEESDSISQLEAVQAQLRSIPDYKDAQARADECRKKIEEIKAKEEADRLQAEEAAKKRKKLIKKIEVIGTSAVAVLIVFLIVLNSVIIPAVKYKKAVALEDAGEYEQAIAAFEELGEFKDANLKIPKCKDQLTESQYQKAVALAESHKYEQAISVFESLDDYKDSKEQIQAIHYSIAADAEKSNDIRTAMLEYKKAGAYKDAKEKAKEYSQSLTGLLAAGDYHTVGLRSDGTVVATGDNRHGQCAVDGWTDIVALAAGGYHTVGLRSDGTVVATEYTGDPYYDDGQCAVDGWTDIVAIAAGICHTVGLRSDGTVVATGYNDDGRCDVGGWTDIVAIAAGDAHTVGLRSDGTVVATGSNDDGQCDADGWTDIVALAAGGYHTVGLRTDGTVVATGSNGSGPCDVDGRTDIVAIAAGYAYTVGLRADGAVVATGYNGFGQCDVDGWTDIVALAAGSNHTVGLRSDGTVVATKYTGDPNYNYGQCDVDGWKNLKLPEVN